MTTPTDTTPTTADAATPQAEPRVGPAADADAPKKPRGPIAMLLDLFSSVRFGITMMTLLFIYSAIGSAGHYPVLTDDGLSWSEQMIRQWRMFELTEFEWFHTWAFIALCGLICINLIVVTLRKIPFNSLKLGVWMIHSGIVTLAVGSVIYFATKVEGDAPVIRREVAVNVAGADAPLVLPALPGASGVIGTDRGRYDVRVQSVLPEYEMLTPGYEGVTDFAVTVEVSPPDGRTFFRQLLDQHPEYVEDSIMVQPTEPGQRPMQRVKNVPEFGGAALADDSVSMELRPRPRGRFWIKDSWAIAVRDAGDGPWTERPIASGGFGGLPRYNDYVPDTESIWRPTGVTRFPIDPLNIAVPPTADDPAPELDLRVLGYLRYAVLQSRRVPGGDELDPLIDLVLELPGGEVRRAQLAPFDPRMRTAAEGNLGAIWIEDESELDRVRQELEPASLVFTIPADGDAEGDGGAQEFTVPLPPAAVGAQTTYQQLGETGYAWRVTQIADNMEIRPGEVASIALVDVRTPAGEVFQRAVASDEAKTVDINPRGQSIEETYIPPREDVRIAYQPAKHPPITVVAGPGEREAIVFQQLVTGGLLETPVAVGQAVPAGEGANLRLWRIARNSVSESRPTVIPRAQRDSNAEKGHIFSMVLVEIDTGAGEPERRWLPYHKYAFPDSLDAVSGLSRWEPEILTLSDGREIELVFTRQSAPLPDPVVLNDFILTAHIGGFTGETSSIRNWTSKLTFLEPDGETDVISVAVNEPKEHAGLWYFQSFWDAPRRGGPNEPSSAGKTFTGLGIGNREGVWTALIGSTLSVIGMIYTFYVKPIIKRRRRERVYRELALTHGPEAAAAHAAIDDEKDSANA